MASHFDFLAHAKPTSLYRLVEKLSMADAAVVMTGVPHNLAIQTLAFYPDEMQELMLSAMRDARGVTPQFREQTARKVHDLLAAARSARAGEQPPAPNHPPPAPAPHAEGHGPAPEVNGPPPSPPTRMAPGSGVPAARMPATAPRKTEAGQPVSEPAFPEQAFSELEPSASILTGSVPDEPGLPPSRPQTVPLTPKFTPPKAKANPASQAQPGQPAQQPPPPAMPRPAAAAKGAGFKNGHNPYESAAPLPEPEKNEARKKEEERPQNSGEMIGQAISELGERIRKAFSPPPKRGEKTPQAKGGQTAAQDGFRTRDPSSSRSAPVTGRKQEPLPADFGKPVPWVPRTATTSPINGPALPGTPPPVAGDPFRSPLAKAGLLDLIGRAQEKYLPKEKSGPAKKNPAPASEPPPRRPEPKRSGFRIGRDGRVEPAEGVLGAGKIKIDKTPRVIGPRPKAEELVGEEKMLSPGARRMDGKAILAAILRNATPEVRGAVEGEDPKLFRELRERMFYFDDLIYTEDAALARVFTAAPSDCAALALKFAAPRLRERVLSVVSPGRARALGEVSGRVGMDDIEAAQKKVLDVALQLQAAGRILIDPRDPDLAG